jgi:hypothetical protein
MESVDFVVRGLNDSGDPSDRYIQVTEVALLDLEQAKGKVSGGRRLQENRNPPAFFGV